MIVSLKTTDVLNQCNKITSKCAKLSKTGIWGHKVSMIQICTHDSSNFKHTCSNIVNSSGKRTSDQYYNLCNKHVCMYSNKYFRVLTEDIKCRKNNLPFNIDFPAFVEMIQFKCEIGCASIYRTKRIHQI